MYVPKTCPYLSPGEELHNEDMDSDECENLIVANPRVAHRLPLQSSSSILADNASPLMQRDSQAGAQDVGESTPSSPASSDGGVLLHSQDLTPPMIRLALSRQQQVSPKSQTSPSLLRTVLPLRNLDATDPFVESSHDGAQDGQDEHVDESFSDDLSGDSDCVHTPGTDSSQKSYLESPVIRDLFAASRTLRNHHVTTPPLEASGNGTMYTSDSEKSDLGHLAPAANHSDTSSEKNDTNASGFESSEVLPGSQTHPGRPQFKSLFEFAEEPVPSRPINPEEPFKVSFFDPTEEGKAFVVSILSLPKPALTADETLALQTVHGLFSWDALLAPHANNPPPTPADANLLPVAEMFPLHHAQAELLLTQSRQRGLFNQVARHRHTLGVRIARELIGMLATRLANDHLLGIVSFYFGLLKKHWDELVVLAGGHETEGGLRFRETGWVGED